MDDKGNSGPVPQIVRATRVLRELRSLARAIAQREGLTPEMELEALDVVVQTSVGSTRERIAESAAERLIADLERRISEAARSASALRPGHVYCFLCLSSDCVHSKPPGGTDTFSGYNANGKPAWQSFTNLCLATGDPRVDRLFGDHSDVIALTTTGRELGAEQLAGFGRDSRVYAVAGQVSVGLISIAGERTALTIQVVRSVAAAKQQLQMNLIGASMDDIVEAAAKDSDRGPAEALRRTVVATRERIAGAARRMRDAQARGAPLNIEEVVDPLLSQARGDLERVFRPVKRRTQHAQERHEGGGRPTSHAMADAAAAPDERILKDAERHTLVVLGPRNRTHVFTPDGRHVTSLQLRPGELDRKVERGRWRPISGPAIQRFRDALETQCPT